VNNLPFDSAYHATYRYRAIKQGGLCVPPLGVSLDGRDFWPRQVFDQYQDMVFENEHVDNYLGFTPKKFTDMVGKVSLLFVITDLREARAIKQVLRDGTTLFEGHSIADLVSGWNPDKDVKILKVNMLDLPVLYWFPDRAYEQYDDKYRWRFDEYGISLDGDYDDSDWDFSSYVLVLPTECPQVPSRAFKAIK